MILAKSLSILLGLHDRSKKFESSRWTWLFVPSTFFFSGKKSKWWKCLSMRTTQQSEVKQTTLPYFCLVVNIASRSLLQPRCFPQKKELISPNSRLSVCLVTQLAWLGTRVTYMVKKVYSWKAEHISWHWCRWACDKKITMAFNLKIILHRMGLDESVFFSQASRNQGVNICPQPRENANNPNLKTPDPFLSDPSPIIGNACH